MVMLLSLGSVTSGLELQQETSFINSFLHWVCLLHIGVENRVISTNINTFILCLYNKYINEC